jgi:molecular chaperone GrpE (heat shock protein)/DNA-binding Xre family transcriptional regulator
MIVISWDNVTFLLSVGAVIISGIGFVSLLLSVSHSTGRQDELLLGWMEQVGISNWKDLQQKAGLSNISLGHLRDGEGENLKFSELAQVAKAFSLPLGTLLDKLYLPVQNPELEAHRIECEKLKKEAQQLEDKVETFYKEGLRLHEEMQQQKAEVTEVFRESTFAQLQSLLTNYPSIHQMVGAKPELPAKNLLSMFAPLDNLLKEWGYEQIGKPWEQVAYDPQVHQPDSSDISEGEQVYVRFVGYQHQGKILCPAKVSRTLPGGA